MKKIGIAFIVFCLSLTALQAQNTAEKKEDRFVITPGERFDFVFGRTAMFNTTDTLYNYELAPTRSGSINLGFSYGIPFGKTAALRFEPRGTWLKMYYNQNADKNWPSQGDTTFIYEKHRIFYLEMPVGLRFNFVRRNDDRVSFYMELGAYAGWQMTSLIKSRYKVDNPIDPSYSSRITSKIHFIPDLEQLRYGLYGRVGVSWLAFELSYRASSVFREDASYFPNGSQGTGQRYPHFSPWQAGFLIIM